MVQKNPNQARIGTILASRKCPATVVSVNGGFNILRDGEPVSRLRRRGPAWEVMWWSHRDKWESIGDFGGEVFDSLDEAAGYVLDDPMGIFW